MRLINKSILFVFGLCLISVACTKEADVSSVSFDEDSSLSSCYSISIDDVYDYLSDPVKTKSQDIRIDPVITDNDTTLFIVNYDNGWEVLSSDRRAPRVFAKSDYGCLSESDLTSVPALAMLYEHFIANIKYLKTHHDYSVQDDFYERWDTTLLNQRTALSLDGSRSGTSVIVKNHLLQTKWGQGHPWNIRAPFTSINYFQRCPTGCLPVAMAQFLYYMNDYEGIQYSPYEDSFTYKYIPDNADYICLNPGDVTFFPSIEDPEVTWQSMPLDSLCVGQSFETVSTLMIDIGRITNTRYYRTTAQTDSNRILSAFVAYLHVDVSVVDVDFDYLSTLIMQYNKPAIIEIGHEEPLVPKSNVHYVVADAIKEYYQDGGRASLEGNKRNAGRDSELIGRYVQFNWGRDGRCDDIWLNTDIINWNIQSTNYNSLYLMAYAPEIE